MDHGQWLQLGNSVRGSHFGSVTNATGVWPAAHENNCRSMCIPWYLLHRTLALGCAGVSVHPVDIYGAGSVPCACCSATNVRVCLDRILLAHHEILLPLLR